MLTQKVLLRLLEKREKAKSRTVDLGSVCTYITSIMITEVTVFAQPNF